MAGDNTFTATSRPEPRARFAVETSVPPAGVRAARDLVGPEARSRSQSHGNEAYLPALAWPTHLPVYRWPTPSRAPSRVTNLSSERITRAGRTPTCSNLVGWIGLAQASGSLGRPGFVLGNPRHSRKCRCSEFRRRHLFHFAAWSHRLRARAACVVAVFRPCRFTGTHVFRPCPGRSGRRSASAREALEVAISAVSLPRQVSKPALPRR